VNMDWWFTNQGVILDTAAGCSLAKRPQASHRSGASPPALEKGPRPCPINGVFIVLSSWRA